MARVAVIVDEMFEDSELRVPCDRLRDAGHEVVIVGLAAGKRLVGKRGREKVEAERAIDDVDERDFDALVIPGGYSPDKLRTNERMVALTRAMFMSGKPVAAVCHGPWMLAEADVVSGRTVTSWPSIKTDLLNAGARWTDREVVVDSNLITSRKPEDLEAFSRALLERIEAGVGGKPMAERKPVRGTKAPPRAAKTTDAAASRSGIPLEPPSKGASRERARDSATRAFEVGQRSYPSRTPKRTRSRLISRSVKRQPRSAATEHPLLSQAKPSAATRRGRGGQPRKERRGSR